MGAEGWLDAWDGLISGGDNAAIEEFWLARLADGVGDGEPCLEALQRLRSAGKKSLAATLLELAAEQSEEEHAWRGRRAFLRELIRLGIGDEEAWRAGLEECVRHLWADRPSLERLLGAFPLRSSRKVLDVLETLETWLEFDVGGVYSMAGRGPGRVVEASPQLGVLRLDFEREKRVPMPIDAARKYLTALPRGHFLRRRLEEPEALAAEVAGEPGAALVAILESVPTPASVTEIRAALGPLLADEAWSAWWSKARKHPRVLTSGSGSRIQYRLAAGEAADDEIRAEFDGADLAGRIELARRHGGRGKALAAWMAPPLLEAACAEGVDAGTAWEALALAQRFGSPSGDVAQARRDLLARFGAAATLAGVTDSPLRETVLKEVRAAGGDWAETFIAWLPEEASARVLSLVATALLEADREAAVRAFLDEVLLNPTKHPAALVWACEIEGDDALALLVGGRLGGAFLVRLVELAERREFGPYRARLKTVLSARGMAARVVQERLAVEQGRRLLQVLEHPGELADERNWVRRAVLARFPEFRQAAATPEEVVPALPATVVRLQEELRRLLEKEIPEVLKAIQVAKEHGDLSENFEYHAARARQEFLSARAANLQGDLARVKLIDPATIDPGRVRVGTRVRLASSDGAARRAVTILGPYEADPERGVLSHATEAAQALLEHAPGEEVAFDGATWRIEAVEPAL